MAYDLEEQESLEELKAWWGKWGTPIMAAVTVVCLAFAGMNGYRWYEKREAQNASVAYQSLLGAIATGAKDEQIAQISGQIKKDYADTVFASLAALQVTKYESARGENLKAADELLWVIEKGKRPEFDTLARLRLASLYIDMKEPAKASAVLAAAKPGPQEKALVSDKMGDAAFAAGDRAQARKYWKEAASGELESGIRAYVQLKIEALSGNLAKE